MTAKFEFENKAENTLRIIRQKTDKNEWAFLEIEISTDLAEVIKRCRSSGIASPFIIHHKPIRRNPDQSKDHWSQILPNYLGQELRKIRDSLDELAAIPPHARPTFHEIRSLGSHLYDIQGYSDEGYVQPLMGHSDVDMTRKYQAGHEIKWVKVKAELSLDVLYKNEMGK